MTMKSIVRISLLFTLLVMGWPAVARAQLFEPIRFTTPFAFEVGQRLLPAGTYVLAPQTSAIEGTIFTLSDTRRQIAFVSGNGLGASPDPKATSDEVVFVLDRATGNYVMCEVWDPSERSGVQLSGTYELTQAAKAREGNAPNQEATVPTGPAIK
jgi:hypothetical protein